MVGERTRAADRRGLGSHDKRFQATIVTDDRIRRALEVVVVDIQEGYVVEKVMVKSKSAEAGGGNVGSALGLMVVVVSVLGGASGWSRLEVKDMDGLDGSQSVRPLSDYGGIPAAGGVGAVQKYLLAVDRTREYRSRCVGGASKRLHCPVPSSRCPRGMRTVPSGQPVATTDCAIHRPGAERSYCFESASAL